MRQLRERGIYKTPDGREYVACAGIFGNYLLYRLTGTVEGFPTYVVDVTGRVVAATQPTPWKSEELLDTERTLLEIYATQRKL
jgi:hypothetical protein